MNDEQMKKLKAIHAHASEGLSLILALLEEESITYPELHYVETIWASIDNVVSEFDELLDIR